MQEFEDGGKKKWWYMGKSMYTRAKMHQGFLNEMEMLWRQRQALTKVRATHKRDDKHVHKDALVSTPSLYLDFTKNRQILLEGWEKQKGCEEMPNRLVKHSVCIIFMESRCSSLFQLPKRRMKNRNFHAVASHPFRS